MDKDDPVHFMLALQKAIGSYTDPILDASKRRSSSFTIIVFKANSLAAVYLSDMWKAFYTVASKFNEKFGVVPVVIIDNTNRLAVKQRELLEMLQDHTKKAADNSIVTFVFVTLEGTVPHIMVSTLSCC